MLSCILVVLPGLIPCCSKQVQWIAAVVVFSLSLLHNRCILFGDIMSTLVEHLKFTYKSIVEYLGWNDSDISKIISTAEVDYGVSSELTAYNKLGVEVEFLEYAIKALILSADLHVDGMILYRQQLIENCQNLLDELNAQLLKLITYNTEYDIKEGKDEYSS